MGDPERLDTTNFKILARAIEKSGREMTPLIEIAISNLNMTRTDISDGAATATIYHGNEGGSLIELVVLVIEDQPPVFRLARYGLPAIADLETLASK